MDVCIADALMKQLPDSALVFRTYLLWLVAHIENGNLTYELTDKTISSNAPFKFNYN